MELHGPIGTRRESLNAILPPCQTLEIISSEQHYHAIGVTQGANGSRGRDALKISGGGRICNIALADGLYSGDEENGQIDNERIKTEVLTNALAHSPIEQAHDSLRQVHTTLMVEGVEKEEDVPPFFLYINYEPEILKFIGMGDLFLLAFIRREGYYDPQLLYNHKKTNMWSYPNNSPIKAHEYSDMPRDTIFIACTDGGLESLINAAEILDGKIITDKGGAVYNLSNQSPQEVRKVLFDFLMPILTRFNVTYRKNPIDLYKEIKDIIKILKTKVNTPDDSTVVFLWKSRD